MSTSSWNALIKARNTQRQKKIGSYNDQYGVFSMTTDLKIRTDKHIKEEAEEIFNEL